MEKKLERSRSRTLVIGVLIGSVLSIGAVGGSVSAKSSKASNGNSPSVTVVDDVETMSMRSGIRW